MVLCLDPAFLLKVNTIFHREQERLLPSFCPQPQHPRERLWHSLDMQRALTFYLERTRSFRQTDALFLGFQEHKEGMKVSRRSLAK